MVGLSIFGIVTSDTWKKNWRYAVIGSLVYGMIFSPGFICIISPATRFSSGISFAIPSFKIYSDRDGTRYYFCSQGCKDKFDKPDSESKSLKLKLMVACPFCF